MKGVKATGLELKSKEIQTRRDLAIKQRVLAEKEAFEKQLSAEEDESESD